MEDQTDIIKHILIVLLILFLVGGGYLYYLRNQDKNKVNELEDKYSQLKSKYNSLLSQQIASSTLTPTPTSTATAEWKTYKNEKYGFELIFNDLWEGYLVERDDSVEDEFSGVHYRVYIPTNSSKWSGSKKGYADPLVISVYKLADWEKLQKEEAPKDILIDKNEKYAFGYSTWQDTPEDLVDTITIVEIKKIIDTFNFIEE